MEETSEQLSQLSVVNNDEPSTKGDSDSKNLIDQPLTNYLLPVYKEYMKKLKPDVTDDSLNNFQITVELKENLYRYIWGPDVFKAPGPQLKRIYDDITAKLTVSPGQSDLEDMLQYHPTEVISSKFIQLVVGMVMIEPSLVAEDFNYLEEILKHERISVDSSAVEAYEFLLHTLKRLFKILTGDQVENGSNDEFKLDYAGLNRESKGVIQGLSSLYMKAFRVKPIERSERMKNAAECTPGGVDWILHSAEMMRMKRRETIAKNKRPTPKEMELVDLSLKMEGSNPFVRWNVIDCVIDSLRESNGRFQCDSIRLSDTNQAMKFLQNECKKLCEDFPKNVQFLSAVSDYFARYVPYVYFDAELAGKLLLDAYQLNPNNPKTTHRLGIFYRMNKKDMDESLKWMERTTELDASHFNGHLDYYKMLIGKPEKFKHVGEKMDEKLRSPEASFWRQNEKTDFKFYAGLAYFAEGKTDDTLRHWTEVMKMNEIHFPLSGVDSDCSIFLWNNNFISTDKIREWIHNEWKEMKKIEATVDAERKKNIERIFHLMLGVVVPKKPDPISGPYSEYFEHSLKA